MKAIRYKVQVSSGVVEMVHGMTHTITEIFIPELKIIFNFHNKKVNVFEASEPREFGAETTGEKIDIGDGFAERLKVFVNLKEEIEEEAKKYF